MGKRGTLQRLILILILIQGGLLLQAGLVPAARAQARGAGLPIVFSRTLADSYRDRSIYVGGSCGDNVYRLGERLTANGADLSRARVVFLLYEEKKFPPARAYLRSPVFFPSHVRDPHAEWLFHVFLEVEAAPGAPMVLDLDYGDEPVPVQEYFTRIFPSLPSLPARPAADRLAHIFLRVIPWFEYAASHRTRSGDEVASYYRFAEVPMHSVRSARQYLRSIALRETVFNAPGMRSGVFGSGRRRDGRSRGGRPSWSELSPSPSPSRAACGASWISDARGERAFSSCAKPDRGAFFANGPSRGVPRPASARGP